MDFDLLLLGKYPFDQLLQISRLAEEGGYKCLWYADEKFFRDPYISLSYIALNTQRIDIGVCVTDPYTRHPAITAMAAATLAELAPTRFQLGLGAGFSGLFSMGIEQTKPVVTLREAIQLMRLLWSGKRTDFAGERVIFRDGQLEFVPPGGRVPVTIAATRPKVLELAGEMADGIIIGDYASAFTLRKAMDLIRKGATRAGRSLDGCPISARVNVILGEDRQAAVTAAKRGIAISLWFSYPQWKYFMDYTPEWEERFEPLKRFVEERGDKPRNAGDYALVAPYTHLVTDEMVSHRHMVGTVNDVVDKICNLPSVGIHRVTVYPVPLPGQTEASIIQVFASQVISKVRHEIGG